MSTDHHTPHATGGPLTAAALNAPLGQLDAAITASGAPNNASYLVTVANTALTAEVAVGATPGGELGGTWASPTIDAAHSGSTHAATQSAAQAAAEATAATNLSTHVAAADPHTVYQLRSQKDANSGYVGLGASQGTRTGLKFLRDDGTWQTVAGTGGTTSTTYVDVTSYGADKTGVADSTSSISSAIAALPAYTAGKGGGTVYFPPGTYRMTSTITLTSGVRLLGAGMRASKITGTFAGALFDTPATGTGQQVSNYQAIEDLYLQNLSTTATATTFLGIQVGNITLARSTFQTSGGHSVIMRGGILVDVLSCLIGGLTGAESGLFLDGTTAGGGGCNGIRVIGTAFNDTKSGIRAINGTALMIAGCSFEAMAGGVTDTSYPASISISKWDGGSIMDNYWEDVNAAGIAFPSAWDVSTAFRIGNNYVNNVGAVFLDMWGLQYSVVFPNRVQPGAHNANTRAVDAGSASCVNNTIYPQNVTSGTGGPISVDVSAVNIGLAPGGVATLPYSASITPGNQLARTFRITATNTTAFTINRPSLQVVGHEITYDILNSSGGALGAITWTGYGLAGVFVNPATTKRRLITFYFDGATWIERSRSAADI